MLIEMAATEEAVKRQIIITECPSLLSQPASNREESTWLLTWADSTFY